MKEHKILIQVYTDHEITNEVEELNKLALNISNLFEFHLPLFSTRIKKIAVELISEIDHLIIIPENLDSNVCSIRKSFDFKKFNSLNIDDKRSFLFEFTFNCLKIVFNKIELSTNELGKAKERILKNGFNLTVSFGNTPVISKDGISASLLAEHSIEYALISVAFIFQDNSNKKIFLFKTTPHNFIYSQLVTRVRWRDNETLELFNNTKEFILQVKINGEVTPVYHPKEREINDVKSQIEFLTHEVLFKF